MHNGPVIKPASIMAKVKTSEGDYDVRDMEKSAAEFESQLKDKTPEEQKSILRQSFIRSSNVTNVASVVAGMGCTLAIGILAAKIPGSYVAAGFAVGTVAGALGCGISTQSRDDLQIIEDYHKKNFSDTSILNTEETLTSINMKNIKDKIGSLRDKVFSHKENKLKM